MTVRFSKNFTKQFKKLDPKIKLKFGTRLDVFMTDVNTPQLRQHALSGKYQGFYSINVTGDIRAFYRHEGRSIVIFAFIGSHSQLYG